LITAPIRRRLHFAHPEHDTFVQDEIRPARSQPTPVDLTAASLPKAAEQSRQ
jgi:hypothetical protein